MTPESTFTVYVDRRGDVPLVTVGRRKTGRRVVDDMPIRDDADRLALARLLIETTDA